MGWVDNLGLLKGGELTEDGVKTIIKRIRDIQEKGGENSPFPCKSGKNIPPVPKDQALPDDIEDKEKYPEFHKNTLGAYRDVLKSLNQEGNFSLPPPFIDPVALAQKLSPPPGFVPPPPTQFPDFPKEERDAKIAAIAGAEDSIVSTGLRSSYLFQTPIVEGGPNTSLKFSPSMIPLIAGPQGPFALATLINVNPIELSNRLLLPPTHPDAIIKPPIPKFDLPIPPVLSDPYLALNANISLPVPAPGFTIPYPDKIEFDLWQTRLPKLFLSLLQKIIGEPQLLLKLISFPPEPCFIIDAIEESGMFGSPEPGANGRTAQQKDLTVFTGQATAVTVVNMCVGDGGRNGAGAAAAEQMNLYKRKNTQEADLGNLSDRHETYEVASQGSADTSEVSGPPGTILLFDGLEKKSTAFRTRLLQIADRLQINVDWIAGVMRSESGFRANVVHGGASYKPGVGAPAIGLIQWTCMKADGSYDYKKLDYYGNMDDVTQLLEVEKYYKPHAGKIKSASRVYQINAGMNPNTAWRSKDKGGGEKEALYYNGNKGADTDGNGILTATEVGNKLVKLIEATRAKGQRIKADGTIISGR